MIIGKEEYLPFKDSLGLMKWCFTSDLPQVAGSPFGQPIGDILQTESLQYDQMKYFERNDVDIARARVLVPQDYINKDDFKTTNLDNINIIEKYDKQDYYELSEENSNTLLNVNNTEIMFEFDVNANVPSSIENEEIIRQKQYKNCLLYSKPGRNSIFTIKIKI
jgi:hypothetical protein